MAVQGRGGSPRARRGGAGKVLAVLAILAVLGGAAVIGAVQYVFQAPFKRVVMEFGRNRHINPPHVGPTIAVTRGDRIPESFGPVGPTADPGPACYDSNGRPLAREDAPNGLCAAPGRTVMVSPYGLAPALRAARAGDTLLLSPGDYRIDADKLPVEAAGMLLRPITVRAARLGDVRLTFNALEGFLVSQPYWVFENLDITGVCAEDSNCEHAFHVVADARGTIIRNNRLRNFNAAIKVNKVDALRPDDVLIERNFIHNDRPRETGNPVTPVDIVAADRAHVVANVIADFGNNGGARISYAAFAKGGGTGALIERNLVLCEWRNRGGTRVGLSLGGGGTTPGLCREGQCGFEQRGGTIRNNVIANCSSAGVYLRDAEDSHVENNLLRDTAGLQAQRSRSSARVINNIIDGHILHRDGATLDTADNVHSYWRAAMLSPVSNAVLRRPARGDLSFASASDASRRGAATSGDRPRDFCGKVYDPKAPPIGPIEQLGANCAATVAGVR